MWYQWWVLVIFTVEFIFFFSFSRFDVIFNLLLIFIYNSIYLFYDVINIDIVVFIFDLLGIFRKFSFDTLLFLKDYTIIQLCIITLL